MVGALPRGTVVADRYRILGILGEGNSGITYRAEAIGDREIVALKALSLRGSDWKLIELFEREAAILKALNHPAIPCYRDSFFVDSLLDGTENRTFYLAQSLAPGHTLADWIRKGWRATEPELRSIARQLLEILQYLQSLKPPVIHRDIKPQNIIRREDGQLFLVDFGAVGHTYHTTMMRGSTVVGTFGYMAPEQFRGQASASTDLYGLGATLLFLLTRRSPAELPQANLALQFRDKVQLSDAFCDWLEQVLAPDARQRPASAAIALANLPGRSRFAPRSSGSSHQPPATKVMATGLAIATIVTIGLGQFRYALINLLGQHHYLASALGDPDRLSLADYLAKGGDWFITPEQRLSLLMKAIAQEQWPIVDRWLRDGTLIAVPSPTPLIHRLVQIPNPQRAFEILERYRAKLDLNQRDEDGRTALMIAPSEATALWLLERGADPTIADPEGKSFLHIAQSQDWDQAFTQALGKGQGNAGLTPDSTSLAQPSLAFLAIESGNIPRLKQILAAGGKLRLDEVKRLEFGFDVYLSRLSSGGRDWFIDALPRLDQHDRYGRTLLHAAASSQKTALVSKLIAAGIRADVRDIEGKTALDGWRMIFNGDPAIGQMLIAAGSPPSQTTFLLHNAARRGDLQEVDRLLRLGSDPNQTDDSGRKPLDYSTHSSVSQRLRNAGGTYGRS